MTPVRLAPAVVRAVDSGQPVVALESALITHGLGHPANLDTARRMEAAVRQAGALPATIAVLGGEPRIGVLDEELARLAAPGESRSCPEPAKISLRDLPVAIARGATGGTTVATTMHLAHLAGVQVLATGGIGGVHRGRAGDVSADLTALGSIPLTVVCSGAKAILDLPRTRELLETKGVTVVGYRTRCFPAFYSVGSELEVDVTVESAEEVRMLARARSDLGLPSALLVCVPVPREVALPFDEVEQVVAQARREAERRGIGGKDLTPFLLSRISALTGGSARRANTALLINNASVAADIARTLGGRENHG